MDAMTGPDGIRVERVILDRGRGEREYLKATRNGCLLGAGYFDTIEGLATVVELRKLTPVDRLPDDAHA